jgi:hypothetical protein
MKKMTAMVLALGLAVPAQAWILFPVRKEIVTVKETNYVVTAVACAITLVASLVAGKLILSPKKLSDKDKRIEEYGIIDKFITHKIVPALRAKYNVSLALENLHDLQTLHLIKNGKDFNDARREEHLEAYAEVARRFNAMFGHVGLFLEVSSDPDKFFDVCLGSVRRHCPAKPLNEQGVRYVVEVSGRAFFPLYDPGQEGT